MRPLKVKTDGKKITFIAEKEEDLTKENIAKAGKKFVEKGFSEMIKKAMKKR